MNMELISYDFYIFVVIQMVRIAMNGQNIHQMVVNSSNLELIFLILDEVQDCGNAHFGKNIYHN